MAEQVRGEKKGAHAAGKAKKSGSFSELAKVLFQAFLIALVVRTTLFQPFYIPSGSLIPTLLIGDYLFVSKYAYGYSKYSLPFSLDLFHSRLFGSLPKRGDVVVFKLPRNPSEDYIKRVIGLPGDKIQMRKGRLYINDEIVPREPIKQIEEHDLYGYMHNVPTYRETLPGGVAHTIIEIEGDSGFYDNTGVYEVPPDHYFMMGDNRDNSADSRASPDQSGVGYVPYENLVGRAELIFFSVDDGVPAWAAWKWPWSVRWNRLFEPIK
jgi:signal peptidase I